MIYVNIGRREVGKTTLAAYLVSQYPARVIFDPRGLYPSKARVTDGGGLSMAFTAMHERGGGEIVVTPDGSVQRLFERTAREVKAWLKDSDIAIAFLVDEARFVDLDTVDFDWILRCATRDSVQVVITAHRPSDITPDVRAISDVWCIFQMTQEHDLKVVAERCGDHVVGLVSKLKPREFVSWDDGRGSFRLHRDPKLWYVPLQARAKTSTSSGALDRLGGDSLDGKLAL